MKIAIIDDEKLARQELKYLLSEHFNNEDINEYGSANDFINDSAKNLFNIIFIDIHLGDINGLMLAKMIKEINKDALIIFVSAYSKYAIDSYDIGVFDYLTKPLIPQRFNKLMDRIKDTLGKTSIIKDNYLRINTAKRKIFINKDDIIYIEACNRKSFIYCKDQSFETSKSLLEIEDMLIESNFFRCHKSFIININYLSSIDTFSSNQYDIYLKYFEKKAIPLSRNKLNIFKELI